MDHDSSGTTCSMQNSRGKSSSTSPSSSAILSTHPTALSFSSDTFGSSSSLGSQPSSQ